MTKDKQDGRPSCQKPVQQGAPVTSGARAWVVLLLLFCGTTEGISQRQSLRLVYMLKGCHD